MAIRNIVKVGDEVLTKKSRRVERIDERLVTLLEDMKNTLSHANGVGLAAPQVGILKRVVVIDVGEGVIELINPEIVEQSGSQTDLEGCLSYPGRYGEVTRPSKVTVRAQDRDGKFFEVTGEGMLARAFCHEIDHLDGVLFMGKVTKWMEDEEQE